LATSIDQLLEQMAAEQREFERTTIVEGYSIATLREVFDVITSSLKNWKEPFIVGNLRGENVTVVVRAIQYFTGDNNPKVSVNIDKMVYSVETIGYYLATGGC
jgi:hypothetical protein